MRIFTVSELKANCSKALEYINAGEKIAIAKGRKREVVAYLVSSEALPLENRTLGLMQGKATVTFSEDFKVSESEFLGL